MTDKDDNSLDIGSIETIHISDRNLILIGKAFVEFSVLEDLIGLYIRALADLGQDHRKRQIGECLLSVLDFGEKLEILKNAVEVSFENHQDVLRRFGRAYTAIEKAQGKRNILAHARWFGSENFPDLTFLRYGSRTGKHGGGGGGNRREIGVMGTTDFETILRTIETATRRLATFIQGNHPNSAQSP